MDERDSRAQVKFLDRNPPHFPESQARSVALDLCSLQGGPSLIQSERDANFHFRTQKRGGFVLKIRPPLVFEPKHADLLICALDKCLAKL